MRMDSTVNSIPNLHLESAMSIRILLGFGKGIRPFLIRFLNPTWQSPTCPCVQLRTTVTKMVEREGGLGEDMGSVRRPVANGARQAAAQGIHVPGVGWKWANQAGCSGPRGWKRKGKEMKRKMGRLGIWPRGDLENSKGFPFYNLFTIIKLIWIQFKFKF
jgi:hypothetical protein